MLKYGTIILHSNVLIPLLLCEYINHKPTSKMVCYQLYRYWDLLNTLLVLVLKTKLST